MKIFIAQGRIICIDPLPDQPRAGQRLPIGSVVHLRSGSPLMVIVDYDTDNGNYVCSWQGDSGAREESFSVNTLMVVRRGGFHHPQKRLPRP